MNFSSLRLKGQKLLRILVPLLFLIMGSLAVISCQDKGGDEKQPNAPTDTPTATPVTEPGSTGTKPPVSTPVARKITGTSSPFQETPTPCDNRRQVQVELSQFEINCAKYDFTALNNEAKALADAELNQVQCLKGAPCSIRNAFYTFWTAECTGTTAVVRIKSYAVCATNTSGDGGRKGIGVPSDLSKPTSLIKPAPVTMDAGENSTFGPIDDGINVKGDISRSAKTAGVTLACPSNSLIVVTYMEKNLQASSIGVDYGPVIQRAQDQAQTVFNQYVCPTPKCTKVLPFTPLYTKWGLDNSKQYVTVDVYFMVTCK
ncbi:MAG TPA: hypothetical protein VK859_15510 [bacterium]|jgi:hypothetical protein|nr:hypothetical protein [bacterium]